jgi:hypothetical protein
VEGSNDASVMYSIDQQHNSEYSKSRINPTVQTTLVWTEALAEFDDDASAMNVWVLRGIGKIRRYYSVKKVQSYRYFLICNISK